MRQKTLLQEIKTELINQFNGLINKVILFGSRVERTARESSDYDVLIVLTKKINWQEKDKILDVIAELNLKYELIIDAHVISLHDLGTIKGKQPYVQKALETGIAI